LSLSHIVAVSRFLFVANKSQPRRLLKQTKIILFIDTILDLSITNTLGSQE
ncbi:hypothetical protein T12_16947, partial [Trichinella patagoniensis]